VIGFKKRRMIISICDYWWKFLYLNEFKEKLKTIDVLKLTSFDGIFKTDESIKEEKQTHAKKRCTLRTWLIQTDGIFAFYLLREMIYFTEFRTILLNKPKLKGCDLILFKIIPPKKDIIDFKWNDMISTLLWNKIECDYMMSWLSTLGGGFSALGEQFSNCAEVAGKISLKQLKIGLRLGDPFLQARCKLYYSISLIQIGRLRAAKKIIRQQYAFALRHKKYDLRLVRMCEGIWIKLQYEYRLRLERLKYVENPKDVRKLILRPSFGTHF